jgi:hypothetical protein
MFMGLYSSENRNRSSISNRSISENDPNTVYPFMCQTIIGSRKPCRVLTKKWSELKPINTATGGITTTVNSSFTNTERYAHYSRNQQEYSSIVTTRNPPQMNNLQGISNYPNSILLYFTTNINNSTTYDLVVTDISNNTVVHRKTFKNTNSYSINGLRPSTTYHISITSTDYLGQQTTITLDKSTMDQNVSPGIDVEPFTIIERNFIPEESKIEYYVLGGSNN